jgi:hypothetical protein
VKQGNGKVDDPRTETDEPGRGHADLAALLGVVVAILLTLTSTPGAWGYTSTIVGAVLLCVLIAFFAPHPSDVGRAKVKWESFIVAIAFAALFGLAGALVGAWPLQDHFFADS